MLLSVNVLVHHGDNYNDGDNVSETVLTPANVNSTDFGKRFSTALDGAVYAQPLYVQNVQITRGSEVGVHSVVYVATMNDSLYAIDANSGDVLWQDSFLNITNPTSLTATSGVTYIPTTALGSKNLGIALGIISTPAIDLSRGAIFLNAATQEIRGSDTHFVQRLWSVSLSDGSSSVSPAVIGDTISNNAYGSFTGFKYVAGPIVAGSGNNSDPTAYPNTDGWVSAPGGATTPVIAFNALIQMQRTSMMLLDGNVYLGFASHGDNGPYYGWLLGYSEASLSLTAAFVTTPNYEGIVGDREDYTAQGGIWASGSAIATDGTYLYVLTGNGAFNTAASNFNAEGFPIDDDYADSLLKLSIDPNSNSTNQNGNGWGLTVADYFTPSNADEMNSLDLDLGSGGVLLLPDSLTDAAGNPMMVFGGKESRIYLVDRNNLGKFNPNYPDTGNVDPRLYDNVLGEYAQDGINGNSEGIYTTPSYFDGKFYVAASQTNALAFDVAAFASGSIPPGTMYTPTPLQSGPDFGYPAPTYTVSANGSNNAILWGMGFGTSNLQAFDVNNIAQAIYDSNSVSGDSYTSGVKFDVPTVANGMVYIANTSSLIGYGLRTSYLSSNGGYFSAPTNLALQQVNPGDVQLTWTGNSTLAGEFRIDRSIDGANWTTLAYVGNSSTTYDDTTAGSTQYFYRVAAVSASSGTLPSNFATLGPGLPPLTGTVIGTAGSYQSDGNTAAKAFDGNLATYFDGPSASGNWVGLDLGSAYTITALAYASRTNWASRMNGGVFQASNSASFTGSVLNLYTIPSNQNPGSTSMTIQSVNSQSGYRYVRYQSPANSWGNVAEIDFFGTPSVVTEPGQLTGNTIGTIGSYQNDGNTIAKATDGIIATFFDGSLANGNWVGLDLGAGGGTVTEIKYASRTNWASRMNGGVFQASNSATFSSGVINLYTIGSNAAPSSTSLTAQNLTNTTAYRYYRYLSPSGSYGNVSEVQFFGTAGGLTGLTQFSGTTIGTVGSYQNDGDTVAKATDNNLSTFFDGPSASGDWVGLDLGTAKVIQQISYAPRTSWAARMVGGIFQASNTSDFSSGVVNLYTIPSTPSQGVLTNIAINAPSAFRYFRYLSPANSYGNIGEFELFG